MRSILVTGGAGFFGKAFARHVLEHLPVERLCIYSRNEWNQAQMRAELGDDPRLRWFIGDVRDLDRLRRAMEGCSTVIHAAALKRIEVVEHNVLEAVATNVTGTENVVKAAIDTRVNSTVLLSTDKACHPTTTYGMTKAMAERIFLTAAMSYAKVPCASGEFTRLNVCRYGNVAGSTGSVIPVWRRLLADGVTELPLTDPDCTRFWMSARQAVDLVMEAARSRESGRLITPLDLPAYRLGDLAEAMGATGFRRIPMGQGEKLHEEMVPGMTSDKARRMSVEELKEVLTHV